VYLSSTCVIFFDEFRRLFLLWFTRIFTKIVVSIRYVLLGHTTYKHILGWRRSEEQSTKSAAFTIAPIHSYTPSQRKAITHHDPEGISPCHHSVFPSPSIVTTSNVLTAKEGKIANLSCRSRVDSVRTSHGCRHGGPARAGVKSPRRIRFRVHAIERSRAHREPGQGRCHRLLVRSCNQIARPGTTTPTTTRGWCRHTRRMCRAYAATRDPALESY